jgi:hypothetical protein
MRLLFIMRRHAGKSGRDQKVKTTIYMCVTQKPHQRLRQILREQSVILEAANVQSKRLR